MAKKARLKKALTPNPLWSGHYALGPAAIMAEINTSIDIDKQLYAFDIKASKAHAAMLVAKNIISKNDGRAITTGLDKILREILDKIKIYFFQTI